MGEYERYPENDKGVTVTAEINVGWSQDEVIRDVVSQVADRIYADVAKQASDAVLASIEAKTNTLIDALFESDVQLTDRWGKPEGKPVSIKKLLQRDAETWLTESVDSEGRKGNSSYGDRHPRVHWLFQRALKGEKNHRGTTVLAKIVLETVKETIGDIEAVVKQTTREQVLSVLKK